MVHIAEARSGRIRSGESFVVVNAFSSLVNAFSARSSHDRPGPHMREDVRIVAFCELTGFSGIQLRKFASRVDRSTPVAERLLGANR